MARYWTVQVRASGFEYLAGGATPSFVPTTMRPAAAFDPDTDQSVDVPYVVPDEHNGAGTLKADIWICANTATAADDCRLDLATEFKTPGAGEAMNSADIDGTPDSGTVTFSTTPYSLRKLTVTLTPATTPAKGDEGRLRITRDANNGAGLDDLAVPALVTSVEIYEEA